MHRHMYVYVYGWMFVHDLCIGICMCIGGCFLHGHMYVYGCMYVHGCMYCIDICMCALCIFTCWLDKTMEGLW